MWYGMSAPHRVPSRSDADPGTWPTCKRAPGPVRAFVRAGDVSGAGRGGATPLLQPVRLALLRGPGRAVPAHGRVVPPGAAVEPGLVRGRGSAGQPAVAGRGADVFFF